VLVKLTDQNMRTHNGFQWELGVWQTARGKSTEQCTDGVLHYYPDEILAVLCNLRHADIVKPRMFAVEIQNHIGSDGLKCWCKSQRLTEEIAVPTVTVNQRIAFGILCSLAVYNNEGYKAWAYNWLTGKDRTARAADAAAYLARSAYAAADAAVYAARAVYAAADAAADAAVYAAHAAYLARSADAALHAAVYAAHASVRIDFILLAHKALEYA
jgi:hypothetical protein